MKIKQTTSVYHRMTKRLDLGSCVQNATLKSHKIQVYGKRLEPREKTNVFCSDPKLVWSPLVQDIGDGHLLLYW